ncbi:hypothetical protein AYO40_01355 [Planctomycetaceae bacterium SCGC AG-212-D15]|nr:hypothetical protein AYO40_01355 [Planctomycetaceae bacterium SCGC AG-212-D15]
MDKLIVINGHQIRTDWIYRIEQGKEKGVRSCSIWFSIGSVGVYSFTGSDAETALNLLAEHPALKN